MVMDPNREKSACGTGLVMDLDGKASHEKLKEIVTALKRLSHRGARGADPLAGDGCGLLLAFGEAFFAAQFPKLDLKHGQYAVMSIFMPKNKNDLQLTTEQLSASLKKFGLEFADKRNVPTNEYSPIFRTQASLFLWAPHTHVMQPTQKRLLKMYSPS
jgi:glutamate synthase (NADPH/NADH) large chain